MERDHDHENAIDGHYDSNSTNNFLNPFVPNAPFLYPLKTLQNLTVFYKFRGQRKGALETNGLNLVHFSAIHCSDVSIVDFHQFTQYTAKTAVNNKELFSTHYE